MSSDYRCVKCGREAPGEASSCPTCNACLLVDVVVDASDLDARGIYLAARDIDTIIGPAPTFDEAKARLQTTPSMIAPECTRTLAQRIVVILHRHDIPTRLAPLRRPRRTIVQTEGLHRRIRSLLRSLFKPGVTLVRELSPHARIAIAGLILIAGFALVMSKNSDVEVSQGSSQTRGNDDRTALSSREIVFAAISSSAQVKTSEGSGIGFFIAPELLVTSARLAGKTSRPTGIVLPDGQRLEGIVEKSDQWFNLALVRVAGAQSPFLDLGDATLLERGETILAVSHPRALDFTASQGIVTHTAWVEFGISYLMIDADSAASGGPILDRFARVVGIVTTNSATRSDLSLALPVNYLTMGEEALLPSSSAADGAERWNAVIAHALQEEKIQLKKTRSTSTLPSLVEARQVNPETVEIVTARFSADTPPREELQFEFVRDGNLLCTTSSTITEWQATKRNAEAISKTRLLQWFQRNHVNGNFYSAKSNLMPYGCPDNLLGATLVLSSGDPRADRTIVGR